MTNMRNNVLPHDYFRSADKLVNYIDDTNLHLLERMPYSDRVLFIRVKQCYNPNALQSFSIKYVIEGCISYQIGDQRINLNEDEILLACQQFNVSGFSDSENEVRSICIDISQSTIEKAFSVLEEQKTIISHDAFRQYFSFPNFLDRIYEISELPYCSRLSELRDIFYSGSDTSFIDHNWFLELAQKIIIHEYEHFSLLNQLNTIKKTITKKEILSRLLKGKKFIDDNYLRNPEIAEAALHSNLSVFYFFRSFKKAFQLTPYHYMMQKRLEHAVSMIDEHKYSFQEIAKACGFPDKFTFSKAFKRHFGFSPSKHVSRNAA